MSRGVRCQASVIEQAVIEQCLGNCNSGVFMFVPAMVQKARRRAIRIGLPVVLATSCVCGMVFVEMLPGREAFSGAQSWSSGVLAAFMCACVLLCSIPIYINSVWDRVERRCQPPSARPCINCLYDVAHLKSVGHCPECGTRYSHDGLCDTWNRLAEKRRGLRRV